jgi:hypothetical protein
MPGSTRQPHRPFNPKIASQESEQLVLLLLTRLTSSPLNDEYSETQVSSG